MLEKVPPKTFVIVIVNISHLLGDEDIRFLLLTIYANIKRHMHVRKIFAC